MLLRVRVSALGDEAKFFVGMRRFYSFDSCLLFEAGTVYSEGLSRSVDARYLRQISFYSSLGPATGDRSVVVGKPF